MINLKMTVKGAKDIKKMFDKLEKQGRFASSVALNRTAFAVRKDVQSKMPNIFDRPTRATINAIRYKKSTKAMLRAEVYVNDEGIAPIRWLSPQIYGASRGMKRSEAYLRRLNLLPRGRNIVPGKGVRLNRFGNITKGQMGKILGGVRDKHSNYFAGSIRGIPGIWERKGRRKVKPILMFVQPPRYKKRFKFFDIAGKSARKHWPREIDKAIEYAIRTAR